MGGECVPLEVKAKTAQAKSVKTVLSHPEKYNVKHIIKFGDYNIGRDGQLLTLPNYMQFLLDLEPEEIVLEPIDVDAVNALASEIIKEWRCKLSAYGNEWWPYRTIRVGNTVSKGIAREPVDDWY